MNVSDEIKLEGIITKSYNELISNIASFIFWVENSLSAFISINEFSLTFILEASNPKFSTKVFLIVLISSFVNLSFDVSVVCFFWILKTIWFWSWALTLKLPINDFPLAKKPTKNDIKPTIKIQDIIDNKVTKPLNSKCF